LHCAQNPGRRLAISLALVFAFMTLLGVTAAQADDEWAWYRVEPQGPTAHPAWDVIQGVARFNVVHGSFVAELDYDDAATRAGRHYILQGTVKDGNVVAIETLMNADAAPRQFRGLLKRDWAPGDAWGQYRIEISDGIATIGLLRIVRVGKEVDPFQ
jgi:hypothetical protein